MTNDMDSPTITMHATVRETDDAFKAALIHTDAVLDIGCGLRPFFFFVPRVHLAIEPWTQYHPLLRKRYETVPGFVLLNLMVPDGLRAIPDKSVDSVFMLDLIEHLEKPDGHRLLAEAERIGRQQLVVFTPLGFMDQSYGPDEKDAWGFDNTGLQQHRSGWLPEELGPGWVVHGCATYHRHPRTGESFGGFYALKTLAAEPAS